MKLGFKRGEKGFTLVELMVVMAIMALLASIVVPAVSGNKKTSQETQTKQDASAVDTAVGKYNADSNSAESLTTDNTTQVLGDNAAQVTSNRWPEGKITANYSAEFPSSTANVSGVIIKSIDGTELYKTGGTTGHKITDFVNDYTAINMATLVGGTGYLTKEPDGYDQTFSSAKPYHNYLWLLKVQKIGGSDITGAGRSVQVFTLSTIKTADSKDELTYQQIR